MDAEAILRQTASEIAVWNERGRGLCERFLGGGTPVRNLYGTLFRSSCSRACRLNGRTRLALNGLDLVARGRARAPGCARSHISTTSSCVSARSGLSFRSPLGVAAGLDKDAEHFEGLGALGFGFVEVGTITPRPQAPNPAPILARVTRRSRPAEPDGVSQQGRRSSGEAPRCDARSQTVVGVNIGKNRETALDLAAQDYRRAARVLASSCRLPGAQRQLAEHARGCASSNPSGCSGRWWRRSAQRTRRRRCLSRSAPICAMTTSMRLPIWRWSWSSRGSSRPTPPASRGTADSGGGGRGARMAGGWRRLRQRH